VASKALDRTMHARRVVWCSGLVRCCVTFPSNIHKENALRTLSVNKYNFLFSDELINFV
jgi:hypothetical protein